MGRSPVFATLNTTHSRPALSVISPSSVSISPGIMHSLPDGLVNADELRTVRERGLHLDLPNHLRNSFHDLLTCQYVRAGLHEVSHGMSIPRALHDAIADERHCFGMIQLHAALQAPPRHHGRHGNQQFV